MDSPSRKGPAARLVPLALVGLLFLLVLVFYRKLSLTNLILADYDLLTYFYPYKEAAAAAFREGRIPLWNPYLFTGVPFLANPQTAFFYPLNLPGYALSAAEAVKYSIVFHVFLAGVFTLAFARSSLGLGWFGALVAALTFMFGGFMTQQVGHINQLNAAIWLPLVLLLFDLAQRRRQLLFALLGGMALASQVLAGHSQETFLLLVAFGLYFLFRLAESARQDPFSKRAAAGWATGSFLVMVGLGLGLTAAQLLPTLELSRESIRGGGLPYREAVSFSLPPWLLARSLLPAFRESPFSEYIAYTGVLPLVLAVYGLAVRPARRLALFWLGLGLLALFLAMGGYNPLYELLYKLAPPLRLFRVPARWLYIYAFAIAALAGTGAHRLLAADAVRSLARSLRSVLFWVVVALAPLALVQWAASRAGQSASWGLFTAWVGLVLVAVALVQLLPRLARARVTVAVTLVFLVGELLVAGAFLPSNTATASQAYDSLRPTVTQLLQDPGLYRILSISRTDFDPGDLPELKSIFGPTLGQEDLYQLVVALKHQEALSPNIPLRYGIATLDGYDGGVLPLRRYVEFKELLLAGTTLRQAASLRPNQPDALLRDQLAGIPDTKLLGFLNVKYIITDKVGDLWIDNVYHDLSAPVNASPLANVPGAQIPGFEATAVGLVYRLEGSAAPSGPMAEVTVSDPTGGVVRGVISITPIRFDFDLPLPPNTAGSRGVTSVLASRALPQPGAYYARLELGEARYPQELSVRYLGPEGRLVLMGVSLMDARTGASQALTLNPHLRLVHSGDLKMYENLDWQPRAMIAGEATWARNDQEALDLLRQGFGTKLVLSGPQPPALFQGATNILSGVADAQLDTAPLRVRYQAPPPQVLVYRPEYVQVQAVTAEPGYLVLTDSFYPGWRAYLDGQETPLLKAQYLFRAVYLPPGSHVVEFRYEPASFRWGLVISLATLTALLVSTLALLLRRPVSG